MQNEVSVFQVPGLFVSAVGTSKAADENELKMLAGSNGKVHMFETFKEFSKEYISVATDSCNAGAFLPPVKNSPAKVETPPSKGEIQTENKVEFSYTKTASFNFKSLKAGTRRVFQYSYESNTVFSLKIETKKLMLNVMYSFDGTIPNARKHDFASKVRPNKKTATIVKPPGEFKTSSAEIHAA